MDKNDIVKHLEQCGRDCANVKGALNGVRKLQELAMNCRTISDYAAFFRDTLHINALEEPDGIVLRLGKVQCSCPHTPLYGNSMQCYCTRGHEVAVWSEFFDHPVDVEILESHLRGGKDCVIKIII